MENGHFEDVFPIKHGDIPASYVSLPEGKLECKKPLMLNFPVRSLGLYFDIPLDKIHSSSLAGMASAGQWTAPHHLGFQTKFWCHFRKK